MAAPGFTTEILKKAQVVSKLLFARSWRVFGRSMGRSRLRAADVVIVAYVLLSWLTQREDEETSQPWASPFFRGILGVLLFLYHKECGCGQGQVGLESWGRSGFGGRSG